MIQRSSVSTCWKTTLGFFLVILNDCDVIIQNETMIMGRRLSTGVFYNYIIIGNEAAVVEFGLTQVICFEFQFYNVIIL